MDGWDLKPNELRLPLHSVTGEADNFHYPRKRSTISAFVYIRILGSRTPRTSAIRDSYMRICFPTCVLLLSRCVYVKHAVTPTVRPSRIYIQYAASSGLRNDDIRLEDGDFRVKSASM